MTIDEFERAASLTSGDPDSLAMRACRLSVTNGMTLQSAARHVGITHPTVYRKMAELRAALALPVCEKCGQTKPRSG